MCLNLTKWQKLCREWGSTCFRKKTTLMITYTLSSSKDRETFTAFHSLPWQLCIKWLAEVPPPQSTACCLHWWEGCSEVQLLKKEAKHQSELHWWIYSPPFCTGPSLISIGYSFSINCPHIWYEEDYFTNDFVQQSPLMTLWTFCVYALWQNRSLSTAINNLCSFF